MQKERAKIKEQLTKEMSQKLEARTQEMAKDMEAKARARARQELEHKQRAEQREYPKPPHIDTSKLNFGLVGGTGVGKSSLINAFLGKKASDRGAAAVGVNECTQKPTPYTFSDPKLNHVLLWDLPGGGTKAHPAAAYVKEIGLRYYDAVLVVTAGRFTEMDLGLKKLLKEHNVPFYMVRTKIDIDIDSNGSDYGRTPGATVADMRGFYKGQGIDIYLVSARRPDVGDWEKLSNDVGNDLLRHRPPTQPKRKFEPGPSPAQAKAKPKPTPGPSPAQANAKPKPTPGPNPAQAKAKPKPTPGPSPAQTKATPKPKPGQSPAHARL